MIAAAKNLRAATEFDRAIWLSDAQRDELLAGLGHLEAISDRTGTKFAAAAEGYAAQFEAAFGFVAGPTAPWIARAGRRLTSEDHD